SAMKYLKLYFLLENTVPFHNVLLKLEMHSSYVLVIHNQAFPLNRLESNCDSAEYTQNPLHYPLFCTLLETLKVGDRLAVFVQFLDLPPNQSILLSEIR